MTKQIQAGLASLRGNKAARTALAMGVLLGVGSAQAEPIDVTAVITALTAAGAAIATVGLAYLAMSVGAKVFKWVKTAF